MGNVKPDTRKREHKPFDRARYVDEAAEAGRPITLWIDDREPLVIRDEASYQKLWELVDALETDEALREALEQVERGETVLLEELDRRMRKKHGISG